MTTESITFSLKEAKELTFSLMFLSSHVSFSYSGLSLFLKRH